MKTKLKLLSSLILVFLAGFGARATVLFQDNFSYPPGAIGIASGGNAGGGGGVWVSGAGSTYGTTADISIIPGSQVEIFSTGTSDLPKTYFTNGIPGLSMPLAPLFTNTVYYFASNSPVAALYASFYLTVDPGAFSTNAFGSFGNNYFFYFTDTNFDFSPRVYVETNTASAGNYRLAIVNSSSIMPTDLAPGNTYQVVVRFTLSTGASTIWVGPANENSSSFTSGTAAFLDGISTPDAGGVITTNNTSTCGVGFRNFASGDPLYIGALVVGTSFADVVSGSDGFNPAFLQTGPQNTTNFAGQSATLSVVAGGDQDTMGYQWSLGGTPIIGATGSSYTVASLTSGDQGSYTVAVTNAANPTGFSTGAFLAVLPTDVVPTITQQPTNTAASAASSVNLTVAATDNGAPLAYQWYLGTTPIPSQTNPVLNISSVVVSNGGTYKVTVTNPNGDIVTSSNAVLTITPPAPIKATIAYIRSLLDTNYNTNANFFTNGGAKLFTVTGTNTVWQNLTTSGNSEFFIQDGTAAICVFWGGAAAATHMPPAGAVVTVTGPVADFSGLLEISPTFTNSFHSVTWSNVTALPTPMAVPFDPSVYTNATLMQKHLVGEYMAATNVFLDQATGPLFGSNANEPLTNGNPGSVVYTNTIYNPSGTNSGSTAALRFTNVNGEVFNVIFYNNHTDLLGAAKPTGPVTIYGVMSIFGSAAPYTNGYEFTPSRLADIVPAVSITNVISNVVRYGDLATNSFATTVLQPGETLTMTVTARDPGAGNATLSSPTGSGTWSSITGNGTAMASATYTYTATVGAEGTADIPTINAAFTSSGFSGTYTNLNVIYVPTPQEQNIRITEVLASPTSNTNSVAYDPLLRALPETGTISVNDQYVEIVNFNTNDYNINRWQVYSGLSQVFNFVNGETLHSNSSAIIYGGPSGTDADPPGLAAASLQYREDIGSGFSFSANGGTVALYDLAGYLIDRVAYPATGSSITNSSTFNQVGQSVSNYPLCSFARFPTLNSPLVPQALISTNYVSPGAQYDGKPWTNVVQYSASVAPVGIGASSGIVNLNFTANTTNTSTLWMGNSLLQPFSVLAGGVFTNGLGSFTISNTPPNYQFYFITTP